MYNVAILVISMLSNMPQSSGTDELYPCDYLTRLRFSCPNLCQCFIDRFAESLAS